MPLARKMYRGGKVWVEVDDAGELVVERGLVKIRYRRDDEREYSAKASEIEEIDEARLTPKGGRPRRPKKKAPKPPPDAEVLVIHTDGISDRTRLEDYPQMRYQSASTVAETIVSRYGKRHDDATALVARFGR